MSFSVDSLARKLDLETLNGLYDKDISGVFVSDMVSDVMNGAPPGCLWVTVQTHKNIIAAANLVDVTAIVVTRGKSIPKETLDIADRVEITIISTPLETFDFIVKLINSEIGLR